MLLPIQEGEGLTRRGVVAALQFKVLPPVQWLSVLFPAVTGLRENQTNYLSNYQTNYLSNYRVSLFTWSWHSCRGALAQCPTLSGNLPGSFAMTWRPRSSSRHGPPLTMFRMSPSSSWRSSSLAGERKFALQWPFCCQADYGRAQYLCCI